MIAYLKKKHEFNKFIFVVDANLPIFLFTTARLILYAKTRNNLGILNDKLAFNNASRYCTLAFSRFNVDFTIPYLLAT